MKNLRLVSAGDPSALFAEVRQALSASGEAILPLGPGKAAAENRPGPEARTGDRLGAVLVPQSVAVVIETSGSTGAPKRVMLSRDALLSSAAASVVALGGPGQWLLALPGHYVAGVQVLVRSIAADTTPVLLAPGHFDPVLFAEAAEQLVEPLRYTSLVPVQLARLLAAAPKNPRIGAVLRRFTAILVGGQAIAPELMQLAEEQDVRVVRTYGSSETAGGCVYNGVPIGNTVVRAVHGQLEICGSVLGDSYLGDPDLTADRFVVERGVRWYRTGDLGEIDDAGLVTVLGRADNVIISGGVKVSLDAVERVVRAASGFSDAVVVAVDDAEWGQVPVVFTAGGSEICGEAARADPADVATAVTIALGRAARPSQVIAIPALPLLASGKPDRHALRRLAAASLRP